MAITDKFEYWTVRCDKPGTELSDRALSEMGANGWELSQMYTRALITCYLFKRRVEPSLTDAIIEAAKRL